MWTRRGIKTNATYWGPGTRDGFPARTYTAPVAVKVFWVNKTEVLEDEARTKIISRCQALVNQTVEEQGYLCLGSSAETDPTSVSGAHRIVSVQQTYGMKGESTSVVAYME